MKATNKNEAIIALISYIDSVIDHWHMSMATIDPEYGYQNEMNEEAAQQVKDEFRMLLNAVIESD